MTHLAVKISTKTVKLRKKVKKLEHDAHVAGHPKREAFYRFIQHKLKQFGNWFYTIWSESVQKQMLETAEPFQMYRGESTTLRWINQPGWANQGSWMVKKKEYRSIDDEE